MTHFTKFMLIAMVLSLFACSLLSVSLNRTMETVAVEAFAYANQPDSPMDEIMRSRETADSYRADTVWLGIGLLLLALVCLGGTLFFLYLGTPFLKQVNQLRRRKYRSSRPVTITPPHPTPSQSDRHIWPRY